MLRGEAESDGFNRLVIGAGLAWRDVTILRAVGKFLRQAAITFSLAYMQQALVRNPDIARAAGGAVPRHERSGRRGDARRAQRAEIEKRIEAALNDVPSLDDDRIIRRFAM